MLSRRPDNAFRATANVEVGDKQFFRLHEATENVAACYVSQGGYYRRMGDYNRTLNSVLRAADLVRAYDRPLYLRELLVAGSVYAEWGPIILPSDKIYSVFIAADRTQWFGTDKGIARHTGNLTLKNWKVFTVKDGLADNFVQAITADQTGKIWIGTKKGISVFDGVSWNTFVMDETKNSNNIRCIAVDKTGVIWFGTDNGVISYENGDFTGYK